LSFLPCILLLHFTSLSFLLLLYPSPSNNSILSSPYSTIFLTALCPLFLSLFQFSPSVFILPSPYSSFFLTPILPVFLLFFLLSPTFPLFVPSFFLLPKKLCFFFCFSFLSVCLFYSSHFSFFPLFSAFYLIPYSFLHFSVLFLLFLFCFSKQSVLSMFRLPHILVVSTFIPSSLKFHFLFLSLFILPITIFYLLYTVHMYNLLLHLLSHSFLSYLKYMLYAFFCLSFVLPPVAFFHINFLFLNFYVSTKGCTPASLLLDS
jgi:hypothetical protein